MLAEQPETFCERNNRTSTRADTQPKSSASCNRAAHSRARSLPSSPGFPMAAALATTQASVPRAGGQPATHETDRRVRVRGCLAGHRVCGPIENRRLPLRETESKASSGRSTPTTATAARETASWFNRPLRGRTLRRKTARPDPSPAGEWMNSGSEGLTHSIGRTPWIELRGGRTS